MVSMKTTLLRLSLILGAILVPVNLAHAKQCDVSLDMLSQDSKDFLKLLDGPLPPIKLFPEFKYINFDKHKRVYVSALVSDKIKYNENLAIVMFFKIAGFFHNGPQLRMKNTAFSKPFSKEIEIRLAEISSNNKLDGAINNLMFIEKSSSISLPDVFNAELNLRDCAIHQIRDDNIRFTVVMVPKKEVTSCLVSGVFAHYGAVNLQHLNRIAENILGSKELSPKTTGVLNPFLMRMYGSENVESVDITKDDCNLRRDLKRFNQELNWLYQKKEQLYEKSKQRNQ